MASLGQGGTERGDPTRVGRARAAAVAAGVAALLLTSGCARASRAPAPPTVEAFATTRTSVVATPTTAAPTTTSTLPTTTVPPATVPPAPAPAPAAALPATDEPPAPASPATDPLDRVLAAYHDTIPDHWKTAVPVHYELRSGATSLSYPDGLESISTFHANGPFARLQFVIGHEFGHEIAFRFGTGVYAGAAPDGWPGAADPEAWADCVGVVFTGRPSPVASHQCPEGAALDFTRDWLASH